MNIALADVRRGRRDVKKSIMVCFRNLLVLADYLNADLFIQQTDINYKKKYDAIVLGFTSMSNDIEKTLALINNNPHAKIFWLVGEYEQAKSLNVALKRSGRPFEIIKNFPHATKQPNATREHFINLNLLLARRPTEYNEAHKKYDCLYYGRWREGRARYFRTYLNGDIYLSTSSKNQKVFAHAGCKPKYIKQLKWTPKKETLNLFRYQLYLEDEFTHTNYNCLANRYYEAGFCNNVSFFDKNCINTIQKSELNYNADIIERDYVVDGYADLIKKIKHCNKNFEKHLARQTAWRMSEDFLRKEVLKKIKTILNGTRKETDTD